MWSLTNVNTNSFYALTICKTVLTWRKVQKNMFYSSEFILLDKLLSVI